MPRKIGVGCAEIGDPEIEAVTKVLRSGQISPGPTVREFEQRFANLHRSKHGIMMNSGTDALRCALAALKEFYGWDDGDEVIVPALTFVATPNVVLQNGLKPVFVDVDPDDFNIDPAKIEDAITPHTRCIMPVDLFGRPHDIYAVRQIAESCHMAVLEDACETVGVGFLGAPEGNIGFGRDARVGQFADIACFSTYACHLVVTGVGGIAITKDDKLADLMRSYMNHGRDPYFLGAYTQEGKDPKELIKRRFSYERLGYSSRASEMEAAVGLCQLDRLPGILKRRQENATLLRSLLSECEYQSGSAPALKLPNVIPINRDNAWMMFPIVVKDHTIGRDELCLYLEERGIETRPLMPLLTQPLYRKLFPMQAEAFPVSFEASDRGFYVGCHQQLTADDIAYMAETITAGVRALHLEAVSV